MPVLRPLRLLLRGFAWVGLLGALGCDQGGTRGPGFEALRSLAALSPLTPPVDRSNRYADDPAAQAFGHRLYFDGGFSGRSTLVDMLGRPVGVPPGRGERGTLLQLSCATCHDPARGGSDHTSQAQVSIGVGAYDVSSQPSTNSAFNELWYWNGRNDSLWAQILAVTESPVSVGGTRLRVLWRLVDGFGEEYQAIFGPLPVEWSLADQKAVLAADGSCNRGPAGACPSPLCLEEGVGTATVSCRPRFPFEGRPGSTAGCQRGSSTEPFGDAFDCMAAADQELVNRVYVNYAKALAAYETTLISQDSPFDRWVAALDEEGVDNDGISERAKQGARLFVGDASCIECHSGPLLTDNNFHNVGVPQDGPFVPTEDACPEGFGRCDCVNGKSCLPWGLWDGLSKLKTNPFRRDGRYSDDPSDNSRAHFYDVDLSEAEGLKRRWKTPGLRDVAMTPPYMHSGRYRTLREVVAHYNRGGEAVAGRDPKVVPLLLNDQEVDALVAFLESLNGAPMPEDWVTAPELPPPTEL